jgi:endonuclease III
MAVEREDTSMYQTLGTADNPSGLYDLPTMANRGNNPRSNGGFTDVKITRNNAVEYWGIADKDRIGLMLWVMENSEPVLDEVRALREYREAQPTDYARRIVIMAMLSAQTDFAENLYCMRRIVEEFSVVCQMNNAPYYTGADLAEKVATLLIAPYRGTGNMRRINFYKTKAANIVKMLPWLCQLTPDQMTLENLNRLPGVGPKVAAFTMALWNPRSPVFTLDAWMMRLTASILGKDARIKPAFTAEGYALVEGDWLAWCHRVLPDMAPFVIQWTLWNGCFGYHRSHLDIIA